MIEALGANVLLNLPAHWAMCIFCICVKSANVTSWKVFDWLHSFLTVCNVHALAYNQIKDRHCNSTNNEQHQDHSNSPQSLLKCNWLKSSGSLVTLTLHLLSFCISSESRGEYFSMLTMETDRKFWRSTALRLLFTPEKDCRTPFSISNKWKVLKIWRSE